MQSTITEEGIKDLVHQFYQKIGADHELGPVFNQAIEAQEWPAHLSKMCDFWSSIMLKSGRYHGNPFIKHKALPAFDPALFDRWLAFFFETAHEVFSDEAAKRFDEASQTIASSLKFGLFGRR
jgi:hemoglobin